MRRYQSWLLALACLLPWVQSVALWHGYGHVPAQLRVVAEAGVARAAPAEAQDLACSLCLSAASLLSAAPLLAQVPFEAQAFLAVLAEAVAPSVAPRTGWAPYAARAPPLLLS